MLPNWFCSACTGEVGSFAVETVWAALLSTLTWQVALLMRWDLWVNRHGIALLDTSPFLVKHTPSLHPLLHEMRMLTGCNFRYALQSPISPTTFAGWLAILAAQKQTVVLVKYFDRELFWAIVPAHAHHGYLISSRGKQIMVCRRLILTNRNFRDSDSTKMLPIGFLLPLGNKTFDR